MPRIAVQLRASIRVISCLFTQGKPEAFSYNVDTGAFVLPRNGSVQALRSVLRITQKHYSPWVKTRQEALDRAVKVALDAVKGQPSA